MIRRAQLSDVSDLVVCVDAAYQAARDQGLELPPVSKGLDQDIRDNLVWVFTRTGRIVGMIVVSVSADTAHLVNIAVHPDAGGQGIGKALIENALEDLRDRGVGRVDLATHIDMPQNVALYAYLGWVETGRTSTKVYMSRDIE